MKDKNFNIIIRKLFYFYYNIIKLNYYLRLFKI